MGIASLPPPSQSHSSPILTHPQTNSSSPALLPNRSRNSRFQCCPDAARSDSCLGMQPCGRLHPVSRRGDRAQPSPQHPSHGTACALLQSHPEIGKAAWHIQWDPHLARSRQEGAGKTGSVPHTSSPFLLPAGMEPPPSPSSPPPSTPPPPPASQPGTSLFSLGPGWGGGVRGQGRAGSPQPPPR